MIQKVNDNLMHIIQTVNNNPLKYLTQLSTKFKRGDKKWCLTVQQEIDVMLEIAAISR